MQIGGMSYVAGLFRDAGAELGNVARAKTDVHARLRNHVVLIVLATIALDMVCALLAYVFEHSAKQTQVTSFGSALFWTTSQLLTVSSSYANPITTGGQILDVIMEIWAIIVVTSTAGAIGAFFVKRV